VALAVAKRVPGGTCCANTEKKGICAHHKDEKVLAKALWCAIFRADLHLRGGTARDETTFEE
jgi:hypothetical protein